MGTRRKADRCDGEPRSAARDNTRRGTDAGVAAGRNYRSSLRARSKLCLRCGNPSATVPHRSEDARSARRLQKGDGCPQLLGRGGDSPGEESGVVRMHSAATASAGGDGWGVRPRPFATRVSSRTSAPETSRYCRQLDNDRVAGSALVQSACMVRLLPSADRSRVGLRCPDAVAWPHRDNRANTAAPLSTC